MVRYITPFREGGSLPALAEGSDGRKYVVKFRGAGQGTKALIADMIGCELARSVGLHVPYLSFAMLHEGFGRLEPDEEIQDLLKFSVGRNLGVYFLSGALTFDPLVYEMDSRLASSIVWLDAFLLNIDRTAKNTNLLYWNRLFWLIDFGATMYFQYDIANWRNYVAEPFEQIKDHVLLAGADKIADVSEEMVELMSDEVIDSIVQMIPADWLNTSLDPCDAEERRKVYADFLKERKRHYEIFVKEAIDARAVLV